VTPGLSSTVPQWAGAELSNREYELLSAFIYEHCGIRYPPGKRVTLEARLRKRLRALSLGSFAEYCPRVIGPLASPDEVVRMIDEVTTNKTDFFREPAHFDFLTREVLPALHDAGVGTGARRAKAAPPPQPIAGGSEPFQGSELGVAQRELVVWSAACSTGEEVYTLAMVLANASEKGPRLRFSILGTDISTEVLEVARRAIYDEKLIEPVPPTMRQRYLLQSRQRDTSLVRIVPELRAHARFAHLNLLAPFTIRGAPHVIFCRNVLIYFDRPTQKRVLDRLCHLLAPGGYLFLGHSDSITGLDLPLAQRVPSVYRKPPESTARGG
jgi:chemotaxis protein methyltransferase CheR